MSDWLTYFPLAAPLIWFAWAHPWGYQKLYNLIVPVLWSFLLLTHGANLGFDIARDTSAERLQLFGIDVSIFYIVLITALLCAFGLLFVHHFKDD